MTQKYNTMVLYYRPYLEAVFHALECTENDYEALFALCLLYAMGHNEGTVLLHGSSCQILLGPW